MVEDIVGGWEVGTSIFNNLYEVYVCYHVTLGKRRKAYT